MILMKKTSIAARVSAKGLVLMSGLMLAGCTMDGAELEDNYVADSVSERYPITVAEAPVKMNVNARSGTLRADQLNSVIGFAQDARNNATSRITVRYASRSSAARAVAQQTVQVLADQGVPRSMIATGSYSGSSSMVTLSFHRKVAVTKECGDWSQNLGTSMTNETYPNQGCAIQQNIAAMVANPEDFETPRAMSSATGVSRSVALKKYNTGESSSSSGSSSGSSSSSSTGSSSSGTSN
jgi:pilus assembly protein CpaD